MLLLLLLLLLFGGGGGGGGRDWGELYFFSISDLPRNYYNLQSILVRVF